MTQAVETEEKTAPAREPWDEVGEAVEHPADGTWSPEVSNPVKLDQSQSIDSSSNSVPVEPSGGWVLKIHPKHSCILPAIDNQTFIGSIWKCGGCGQHWQVFEKKSDNASGIKAFKRISEEVVSKRLAKAAEADDES